MIDMTTTISPKSDQLNADDLIAGPRTIRVSAVRLTGDEQPVAIHFDGDNGKPFRPCKSMRRVLVACWGPDASQYTGRSMTIYRDNDVQFGGLAVGGIRISHVSHIEQDRVMALTATRKARKPYTVRVLKEAGDKVADGVAQIVTQINNADSIDDLRALMDSPALGTRREWLRANRPEMAQRIDDAISQAQARLNAIEDAA